MSLHSNQRTEEKVVVKVNFHFCRISLDSIGGGGGGGGGGAVGLALLMVGCIFEKKISF